MTLDEFNSLIKKQPAVLIYFSGIGCSVCTSLQPKIKEAFTKHYPKIEQHYLDIQENNTIAVDVGVFSMPTILVFLDGKEFIRKSRNMSVDGLIQDLKRPYNLFFEN